MRKIGDKVLMIGGALASNKYFEVALGKVVDDLGNGYFKVLWHFYQVPTCCTINHERDLKTFVRASTAELR